MSDEKEEVSVFLNYEKIGWIEERIEKLEQHDIFRIWKSARQGGKATLSAILNLNQGVSELKENINNVANSSGNFEDMLLTKIHYLEEVLRDVISCMMITEYAMSTTYGRELLERLSGDQCFIKEKQKLIVEFLERLKKGYKKTDLDYERRHGTAWIRFWFEREIEKWEQKRKGG